MCSVQNLNFSCVLLIPSFLTNYFKLAFLPVGVGGDDGVRRHPAAGGQGRLHEGSCHQGRLRGDLHPLDGELLRAEGGLAALITGPGWCALPS